MSVSLKREMKRLSIELQRARGECGACSRLLGSTYDRALTTVNIIPVRNMEVHEISMSFTDSGHAADKRRRSQACCFLTLPLPARCTLTVVFSGRSGYWLRIDFKRPTAGCMCVAPIHKTWGFSKSRAASGIVGPLGRARVGDFSEQVSRQSGLPVRTSSFAEEQKLAHVRRDSAGLKKVGSKVSRRASESSRRR